MNSLSITKYYRLVESFLLISGLLLLFGLSFTLNLFAQNDVTSTQINNFRVGEKITYNVSFNKYKNAAVAEIYCVSRGKLQGKDAVELRMKMKTVDFVSAAFHNVNESRIVFADVENGLPIFTKIINNETGFPVEKTRNLFLKPTANFDLLTAIYRIRYLGGSGNLTFQDSEIAYPITFQIAGSLKIKTEEKEFDTNATTVESQYFGDKGITNVVVYFSNDEQKIPVQIKFKTVKGEFIATVASIQNIIPEQDEPQVAPTPKPTPTPFSTPKPIATPIPYKENQSLPSEFPFNLGEKLTFAVSTNGLTIANVNLHVKERKLLFGKDNVTFVAGVSDVVSVGKFFKDSDLVSSFNDPFSLTPNRFEIKLGSIFSKFNQTVQFDQNRGVVISGPTSFEIPIGTYDLLSFAYAIRSFNLKPSKDPSNPVNDTRVAVFVGSKAVVFTLRPQNTEQIEFQGRKISAQKISFSTGNLKFDSLSPQLWLSNDRRRLPIKFSITYNGKVFNVQLINVTN